MVDIIDVALARAMTPQGQIDIYAKKAQNAVANATHAVELAENATQQVDNITTQASENLSLSEAALENSNETLNKINGALAIVDEGVLRSLNTKIDKLAVDLLKQNITDGFSYGIETKYPSGKITNSETIIKMYTTLGQNEDGTMTQKAITDAIKSIPSGGGSSSSPDMGSENAGKVVVVGEDGQPTSGTITEKQIIDALVKSGDYVIEGAVGLQMDYENRIMARKQDAENLNMGQDFDKYPMYGGRIRCNVADDGTILAFYGDANYKDDGTNGQVMVYQPKFYYNRTPIKTTDLSAGKAIKNETLIISSTQQPGFKLHPAFINESGEEVEYILLSAYNGSVYDTSEAVYDLREDITIDFDSDKLSSISNAKPVSGAKNQLTMMNAEKLAKNRGTGWHIITMATQSAEQMLEIIEFGSMNGQSNLEIGVCNIGGNLTNNCSSLTGSAPVNGAASATTNEINGNTVSYTNAGRRAISYRGVENPWGNIWNFIGGSMVYGDGNLGGGIPYICKNFNYSTTLNDDYESVGFNIPNSHNWITAMGYGNEKYDWTFIPVEINNGNSALPIGDTIWPTTDLNTINFILIGGYWNSGLDGGPFHYGCDRQINHTSRTYGARLVYIPEKNSIYNGNIVKWTSKIGG